MYKHFFGKLALLFLILLNSTAVWSKSVTAVQLTWKYEDFPLKMQVFNVKPQKSKFISETANVKMISDSPALGEIKGPVLVQSNTSYPVVLIVENKTDQDQYFFAVPHELHPPDASVGHYFECLCVGKVYKIPSKKIWYRIARINLDKTFQNMKKFEIDHKIVGIKKADALTKYAERLYEKE